MNLSPAKQKEKWMTCPTDYVKYPGLAYIYHLNQLIVYTKLDELHKCMGKIEVGYTIYNNLGEKVFLAISDQHDRNFFIKVFNIYGNEVINIKISKACTWCCNKAVVWAPPDHYVGSVEQRSTFTEMLTSKEKFLVKNSEGKVALEIVTHGVNTFMYSLRSSGKEVGVIMEKWGNEENFGVTFPEDLGVEDKAVVLGACFLIGCLKY